MKSPKTGGSFWMKFPTTQFCGKTPNPGSFCLGEITKRSEWLPVVLSRSELVHQRGRRAGEVPPTNPLRLGAIAFPQSESNLRTASSFEFSIAFSSIRPELFAEEWIPYARNFSASVRNILSGFQGTSKCSDTCDEIRWI